MINYLVLNPPLGLEKFPTLKQLSTNDIVRIWASACYYLRIQLLLNRAVNIGIGTFAVVKEHVRVGEGEVLPLQRPVFQMCRFFKRFYRLRYAQKEIPDDIPVVQLSFEQIAKETGFLQEAVQWCIEETLLFFAGAVAEGKEVEMVFKDMGVLAVRRQVVTMNFFDHCLMEVDATGNMFPALLTESKMIDVVTFVTRNDFSRFSRDGVIVLPRFALEITGKTSAHARSVKPREELVPGEHHARKVSLLDPVLLARRRISLAKLKLKDSEEFPGKEGGHARSLPAIRESFSKTSKQPKFETRLNFELPDCVHQPSGKGVCYLCTDPAERRLRLLMASKRKEIEDEILGQFYENRPRARAERDQTTCRHLREDPGLPSHVLRKQYDEKLKEQMKERALKNASQRASEGRQEPPLTFLEGYRAQQGEWARKAALNTNKGKEKVEFICKGEKQQLWDRRQMPQALPAVRRSSNRTHRVQQPRP
ncbi:coiled-coil domain-containing protein 81-like [Rhea pennata]|uniref:coiled-coil domain-containing protein 81-like n=1 Tax=Rhea pennata TaxID=8795 RepID=UPI002E26E2ED